MKIVCPHCQKHYEIDDSYAGNWTICESCGKNFAIPDAETISSAIPEAELIQEAASESNQDANSEHCPFCGGELAHGVKNAVIAVNGWFLKVILRVVLFVEVSLRPT